MHYNVTKLLFLPFQKKHNETFSAMSKCISKLGREKCSPLSTRIVRGYKDLHHDVLEW